MREALVVPVLLALAGPKGFLLGTSILLQEIDFGEYDGKAKAWGDRLFRWSEKIPPYITTS